MFDACHVESLSAFTNEKEILWSPCTFQNVTSVHVKRAKTIIKLEADPGTSDGDW